MHRANARHTRVVAHNSRHARRPPALTTEQRRHQMVLRPPHRKPAHPPARMDAIHSHRLRRHAQKRAPARRQNDGQSRLPSKVRPSHRNHRSNPLSLRASAAHLCASCHPIERNGQPLSQQLLPEPHPQSIFRLRRILDKLRRHQRQLPFIARHIRVVHIPDAHTISPAHHLHSVRATVQLPQIHTNHLAPLLAALLPPSAHSPTVGTPLRIHDLHCSRKISRQIFQNSRLIPKISRQILHNVTTNFS